MLKDRITRLGTEAFGAIARAHGLRLIVLHGSVARGTDTPASDMDIGVLGKQPVSYEETAALAEEIARLTGVRNVDVRSLHRVSPLFLQSVMDGIILWTDDPSEALKLKLYAWKLAAETKHLRDARFARVRERILAHTHD